MTTGQQNTDPYAFCAQFVYQTDPDRFADIMTLDLNARKVLFAGFAFSYEIAKAAVASNEPHLCAMRLEWWRQEITRAAEHEAAPDHEISAALAPYLCPSSLVALCDVITARDWDVFESGFENTGALEQYLERSMGQLYRALALMLGADGDEAARYGAIVGLQRWLYAASSWQARGRKAWGGDEPEDALALRDKYLVKIKRLNKIKLGKALCLDRHRVRHDLRRLARSDILEVRPFPAPNAARVALYRMRASLGF